MDGSFQRHRCTVVTLLFLFGMVVTLALWALEARLGLLSGLDQIAYPAMVALCATGPLLLHWLPHRRAAIELATYGILGIYFLSKLAASLLAPGNFGLYHAASLLIWLPFLYVVAFVLFERRVALIAAGTLFGSSLLPPLVVWPGATLPPGAAMLLFHAYAAHGLILGALSLITLINARYERAAEIARDMESAALTDTLTGLPNRRGLERLLRSLAGRGGRRVGLALLDLDHFKAVNDRFGHLVGDDLLALLARRMRQALPDGARLGRWGGEEFLLVVLDDATGTASLAESLRQAVAGEPHPVAGCATLSAGIAIWSTGRPIAAALRRADAALYRAKAQGRDRVVTDGSRASPREAA
ncbi:GGDEF domain-containing protein [Pseudoroseomonas globiformis]|uniref:diguanylate cyclase n=1 Tax=Teichococcus globiformis TaxID=2307229 RepID=A0ABV7G8J2_9PROT